MWRLVEHGRQGDPAFYFGSSPHRPAASWTTRRRGPSPTRRWMTSCTDALRANLPTPRESSFRRFRLGQWVQDDDAWLPAGMWAPAPSRGRCRTAPRWCWPGRQLPRDARRWWSARSPRTRTWTLSVLGAADGTATGGCRWSTSSRDPGGMPPLHGAEIVRPVPLAAVPAGARREGLPVMEFPQSPARMTPATTRLFEAVVNRHRDPLRRSRLARHVANAPYAPTPAGHGSPRSTSTASGGSTWRWARSWRTRSRRPPPGCSCTTSKTTPRRTPAGG